MTTNNDKKLLIYGIISLIIFLLGLFLYSLQYNHKTVSASNQSTQEAHTAPIKTYEYIITKINSEGIHGKSTIDNTGIFLVSDNLPKGMTLKESDHVKVSFPVDDWETITKVEKIKNN